jgi:hypothetical protein
LSNRPLAELIFKSSDHVQRILTPSLKALSAEINRRQNEVEELKPKETNFMIDF